MEELKGENFDPPNPIYLEEDEATSDQLIQMRKASNQIEAVSNIYQISLDTAKSFKAYQLLTSKQNLALINLENIKAALELSQSVKGDNQEQQQIQNPENQSEQNNQLAILSSDVLILDQTIKNQFLMVVTQDSKIKVKLEEIRFNYQDHSRAIHFGTNLKGFEQQKMQTFYSKDSFTIKNEMEVFSGLGLSLNQNDEKSYIQLDSVYMFRQKKTLKDIINKLKERNYEEDKITQFIKDILSWSQFLSLIDKKTIYNGYQFEQDLMLLDLTIDTEKQKLNQDAITYLESLSKEKDNPTEGQIIEGLKVKFHDIILPIETMEILSPYDFKKRLVYPELKSLVERNPEEYLLDNYDQLKVIINDDDKKRQAIQYGIKIQTQPLILEQVEIMDPSNLLLKRNVYQSREVLELKNNKDFSQQVYKSFYEVAPIDTWGIFIWKNEEILALKMLQVFAEQVKLLDCLDKRMQNPPKIFTLSYAEDINEWFQYLKEKIVEQAKLLVQTVIIVLPDFPDSKKTNLFKREIKKLMNSQIPVFSVIMKSKQLKIRLKRQDLFNIKCQSVLFKAVVKSGSTPFICQNLPLMEKPTMILGLIRDNDGISVCATLNKELSQIYGNFIPKHDILTLTQLLEEAFCSFKSSQNVFPQKVIIYRQISKYRIYQSDQDIQCEIKLLRGISEKYKEASHPLFNKQDLIFITVDQNFQYLPKLFSFDNLFKYVVNSQSDLLIDNLPLVSKDTYAFFIIKQPKQKIELDATGQELQIFQNDYQSCHTTYFHVRHDSTFNSKDRLCDNKELKQLTNRLSYCSYEKLGSSDVPCVIDYALRLRKYLTLGKIEDQIEVMEVHPKLKANNGFYFL
ncbi:macronuclear development protein 1 [Stylonychia lemnae]|uniref:Macronuclear development protein 1 n=1 Tax=Stylonychia lemnae TaxID=5949 RepID=A0A078AED4_STYLE|nr:macronuclear development protein 1 [Stylonychia lemnae]|eukprot:CDW79278.1 macronuclear development protein 1 [Stylonychia lemnae]